MYFKKLCQCKEWITNGWIFPSGRVIKWRVNYQQATPSCYYAKWLPKGLQFTKCDFVLSLWNKYNLSNLQLLVVIKIHFEPLVHTFTHFAYIYILLQTFAYFGKAAHTILDYCMNFKKLHIICVISTFTWRVDTFIMKVEVYDY